jgi:radical SAM protein with 4Fe4S-binding SPASM domain
MVDREEPLLIGPAHVDVDVTNACNLSCSHCDVSSGIPLAGELHTAGFKALIDNLYDLGVLSVTVAGGEPFLRRDGVELLAYACAHAGWNVTVITNGMFLTPEIVLALRRSCPGLRINISLDGSNPDILDLVRHGRRRSATARASLFSLICGAVRRAVDAGLDVHVNSTLTAANHQDLAALHDLVRELGARSLLAIKFFAGGRGLAQAGAMEFDYPTWAAVMVDLTRRKLAGELPGLALSVPAAWEFYLPLLDAGIDVPSAEEIWGYQAPLRDALYGSSGHIGDPSGITDLNVVGNGDVYPITLMSGTPSARCGTVTELSLAEIWRSSATLWRLRDLRIGDLPAGCQTCEIGQVCGGGSRARALVHTGDLAGPDVTCPRLTPHRIR